MRITLAMIVAAFVGFMAIGCSTETATKKTETTVTTPGGETKTSTEVKVETTPDSSTKTTTEKVEKSGDNPPPANP